MSAIIFDESVVHYEVLGRGYPVIFLHSWVGSWRYWIPCMQTLSTGFRAYALDLYGFGDTSKIPELYMMEKQVLLLNGFLEHMGINKVTFIGHGLGGIVGLYYSVDNPQVVDRLILVGLPINLGLINPRLLSSSPKELANWLFNRSSEIKSAREDAAKTDSRVIQSTLGQIQRVNWRQLLLQTSVPSLWIYGQNDPLVAVPHEDLLSDLPELGHWLIFEQSGHYPMLDEARKFNRMLIDFLALDSAESPRQLQLKEEWKRRVR